MIKKIENSHTQIIKINESKKVLPSNTNNVIKTTPLNIWLLYCKIHQHCID